MKTATEYWKEKFGENPQNDAEKLAVVMMTEYLQSALGEQGKWVSCEESTPKEGHHVLQALDHGDYVEIYAGNWQDKYYKMNGVTHWMELPPPPNQM